MASYTAGLKALVVYSTNTIQRFILHTKMFPDASSPLPCSTSSKSCTSPCLQGYCSRGDDQLVPLNTHLYQEANLLLGGLAARTAVPLWESPERHETNQPLAHWRTFSNIHSDVQHRQRKTERGGRKQLKQWEEVVVLYL